MSAAEDIIDCRCGRQHQPRERLVACSLCGSPTTDVHAVCTACVELAGLAALTDGEGRPADAAGCAAKVVRPASTFNVAAVLCGHDVSCEAGREAARHDFRVWDLIEVTA